jgi:hypothetical protein
MIVVSHHTIPLLPRLSPHTGASMRDSRPGFTRSGLERLGWSQLVPGVVA